MDFTALVQAMTPDIYEKLAEAVATGRWADGNRLSDAQREHSLQLVAEAGAEDVSAEAANPG